MPSLCADLEDIAPGLWAEFCSHEGDESQPWRAKIDGQIPCLDRDWRKIIFRFFDYVLTNKSFLDSSYRPDGKRLESIVHPVGVVLIDAGRNTHIFFFLSSDYTMAKYSPIRSLRVQEGQIHWQTSVK